MTAQPSTSISEFQKVFQSSKFIVVLTGAGISAESGIPTFRGEGAYWRGFSIEDIAMMSKFTSDPSLVWELYHFRREVVFPKIPNVAHTTLTEVQERLQSEGKTLKIITQNIDELHTRAGSKDVIELHGTLFKTRCINPNCAHVADNYDSPICPALDGKGCPDKDTPDAAIPPENLPRCVKCSGLVRPHIIWFDEDPTDEDMKTTYEWLDKCDLMMIIGTSSIVPPANEFGPYVAKRGVPVAEFNLEHTPATLGYQFHISGPCGTTLPNALKK
ncbi:NAD-dependent protein deacylase sirtuin-5, mitochondrial [Folsomia candida]|uniref:NAD-dependent protein deacylase sirtuin-5, mitochondrial n=1 Tax=Folsomia candida TaxID=158441 RepID=A0A226D8G6_FOLCA|nr:NAD-dependent protein deacylase sirtuin-5, mitochondrial [Folsomia candida]OXA40546.1 NAD-dependent protein deacylase sirtuin-5, mitochondrial [Folsomia candida]